MKVSAALAGAASETSTTLRVKSRAKKLSAIEQTPSRNMGLPVTALIAPGGRIGRGCQVEVADAAHGPGGEDVAGDGGGGDGEMVAQVSNGADGGHRGSPFVRVLGERGAVGDEAHAADDEQDAEPAVDEIVSCSQNFESSATTT
jgi:hypothetical protein